MVESQPAEALAAFDGLTHSKNAEIRAAALVRKARVLRNMSRTRESIVTYQDLAAVDANVAGVPAALVAQHAICQLLHGVHKVRELRKDLSSGRWRLTRAQFNFYWSEASRMSGISDPPPVDKRHLTEVADFVWMDRMNHPEARGQEIAWIDDMPILLIWRGLPEQRRVLAARPDSFVPASASMAGIRYAFVDGEGRVLAGAKNPAGHSVVRTADETQLPWTLLVSGTDEAAESNMFAQRQFLMLGLSVMMGFLVLGTYSIARAMHREAEIQRMQSHFVSSVSHEFRSPLTSMRQLSEMLALGRVATEERRQQYYETLVRETARLQRLIEGLLNFGRMEVGARRYRFEELDPFPLIQGVVDELEPQMASVGKQIETVRTSGPCRIEADTEALSVALRNLLDNAVKYSPDQPTIWVECGLDRSKVAIRVRDQGLGIADSERRRIFDRFMRGSAAAAANVKGSGVGLAMVNHIVRAHGGEIILESRLGQGSTFTMLFPQAEGV